MYIAKGKQLADYDVKVYTKECLQFWAKVIWNDGFLGS